MQLTEKEINLIKRAEVALKAGKSVIVLSFIILLILFCAMLYGIVPTDIFAYSSTALVIITALLSSPRNPSYEELVSLLLSIRSRVNPNIQDDPLIKALSGNF